MRLVVLLILCLLIFLSLSTLSNAVECRLNGKDVAYTITVSQSAGQGNFTKVQDAVNAVPSGNDQWIKIYVYSGRYWEQVNIPYDKECILLEGQSEKETMIAYNAFAATDKSPTFISGANNFVAKKITFKNTYNVRDDDVNQWQEIKQAVAASVYGDKSAFYNCDFVGFQDTLWDIQGRHFFKSCYIEGAIDFIWGSGQSVYEDCQINVSGNGFITAQGRSSPNDPNGYVFIRGQVSGSGNAYLGRAYGAYSRVIFQQTSLSRVVNPLGWDAWHFGSNTSGFTYAEVGCTGDGADTSRRVFEKQLDPSELSKYSREAFIDVDGWISRQP